MLILDARPKLFGASLPKLQKLRKVLLDDYFMEKSNVQ